MKVDRGGWAFEVVDDPATRVWRFWEDQFASGVWEPGTLDLIDRLGPADTFLDVGAWVSPTVLWAARRAGRVVAVEPDPVAADVLAANILLNGFTNVEVVRVAVSDHAGVAQLSVPPGARLGDSMSSLVHTEISLTEHVMVGCVPFDSVLDGCDNVGLVKIDIEGGEIDVFPSTAARLRSLGCPIILALHYGWLDHLDRDTLRDAIAPFKVVVLDDTNPLFPTLALYPR